MKLKKSHMRNLKFVLIVLLPVFCLSCNEGRNRNDNRQENNMENREDKGTNQGMDRDTLSQGSLMFSFTKPQNIVKDKHNH